MKTKLLTPSETEIIKSRNFGHVVGSLNRNQRVGFSALLKEAYGVLIVDPDARHFKVSTDMLVKEMGINKRNIFKRSSEKVLSLEDNLTELLGKILEWRYKKDGLDTVAKSTMLSRFEMNSSEVIFNFSDYVRDRIIAYGNAYIMQMPILAAFRSGYAVALFEQLEQRRDFKKWPVSIKVFREMMGVLEGEHKKLADFKKRVLSPAIKEINLKTDYNLTYDQIKEGRSITRLIFSWTYDEKKKENSDQNDELDNIIKSDALLDVNGEYLTLLEYEEQQGYYYILVRTEEGKEKRAKISQSKNILLQYIKEHIL